MKNLKNCGKLAFFLVLTFSLSACMQLKNKPLNSSLKPPTIGYQTETGKALKSLPQPKRKIVVTVYDFPDQSGQYEEGTTSTNFSTSLSQGNTSILIEALEKSGWFEVIERKGLNDLLTERKIISAVRSKSDKGPLEMPNLLFAEFIISGGIVSYEKNIHSSGLGVSFTGIGGNLEVREDVVTVSMRSISTANGAVTASSSTNNSIYSQRVNASVFRFISYKKLLEGEAGYSNNEPRFVCVQEGIEKAVYNLILENTLKGVWQLENPQEINAPQFKKYLISKGLEE